MQMMDTPIDYSDVQGTILRGYRVDLARHFILRITNPAAAGAFIGNLVSGTGGLPAITTAAPWMQKPECFVNISFTSTGLAALGVSAADLATFDQAFQRGATSSTTAEMIGDVGASAPANWVGGLSDGANVHVVLNLWVTSDPQVLESVTAQLRAAFAAGMTELSSFDANALPDTGIQFGYRDSISQPTIQGAPPRKSPSPDDQPVVATGEFLQGYPNQDGGVTTLSPTELSTNCSYAAFRILRQDVAGFESFLTTYAAKAGIDPELLAAKVCGRWRNGNPLELSPTSQLPLLPDDQLNDFTYCGTDAATDDTLGLKCPIGSHLRRNNPRNEAVIGAGSPFHRIVRRAMPYGPVYDPAHPDDTPRGLIGYFINASLTQQFEFLQSQWNATSTFVMSASGPGGSSQGNAVFNISGQDVFLGVNDPSGSSLTLAAAGANGKNNTTLTGFSRMVTTVGSVYCFFPSIAGLAYLSKLPAAA
jgi:deferrochelatase/peroxidase EfeB